MTWGRRGPISRYSERKSGMPGRCSVLKGQFTLLWRDNFWSQPHTSLLRLCLALSTNLVTLQTIQAISKLPSASLLQEDFCLEQDCAGPKILVKTCLQHSQLCLSPPPCQLQLALRAKGEAGPRATTAAASLLLGPTHRHHAHPGWPTWTALPLFLTSARSQNCSDHINPVKGSKNKELNL